jgi:hypothetical protein
MIKIEKRRIVTNFVHTGNNPGTFHVINHNFGNRNVKVEVRYPSDTQGWSNLADYFANGSSSFGFEITNCTPSQVQIRMFQYNNGTPTNTYTVEAIITED